MALWRYKPFMIMDRRGGEVPDTGVLAPLGPTMFRMFTQ